MIRAVLRSALGAQVARHLVVLANVASSRRWLAAPAARGELTEEGMRIAVVLPMLREQTLIAEAVAHFQVLLRDEDVLLLVTSAREKTGTPELAAALADGERIRHLHLEDKLGRKGDQINLGAEALADRLPGGNPGDWLVLVYDADSRPPRDSLFGFAAAAAQNPEVAVFHQSARFEVRDRGLSPLDRALARAGALRANRFVLAYELPRLRSRSPEAGALRRLAASVTYGHVSGHGLALRLDFLLARPMPSRTLMEDMHYSYGLAVDDIPVVPVSSLDRSEVPTPWRQQFGQAERWFAGPSRTLGYLVDGGRTGRGLAVSVSALLISLEWLSCLPALPLLVALLRRPGSDRALASAFLAIYVAELLQVSRESDPGRARERLAALLTFPLVNAGFGAAGWSALLGGPFGRRAREKTER